MTMGDPLLAALIRREMGDSPVLPLAGFALIAVAAAWTSSLGLGAGGPLRWLARFDRTLPVLLALIAGLRLLQRPAEDQSTGWVAAYCGNTGRRIGYAFATAGSVVIVTVVALVFGEVVFFAGTLLLGGADTAAPGTSIVMGTLLIVSVSLYCTAVGLLTRDFGVGLLIALMGVAIPIAIAVSYALARDSVLPALPRHLLLLHVPPMSLDLTLGNFVRHLLYAAAGSLLVWRIAPSAVARQ